MMTLVGLILTTFLISVPAVVSPGPLSAMALAQGVRTGKWAGTWLALGHGIAEGLLILGITLGLGVWLDKSPVRVVIGLAGGGLLAWMGWNLIRDALKGGLRGPQDEPATPGQTNLLSAGALLSASNPYWMLWWLSVGAGLIAASRPYGLMGLGIFFVTHWLTDLLWLTFMGFLAGSGRGFINERVYRGMLLACGLFLLAFSGYFLYSGFRLLTRPG